MVMDIVLFALYLVVLILLAVPMGKYMAKVFTLEKTIFDPIFRPIEKCIYRLTGVNPEQEMNWKQYAVALLLFNLLGALAVYMIQIAAGQAAFQSGRPARRTDLGLWPSIPRSAS